MSHHSLSTDKSEDIPDSVTAVVLHGERTGSSREYDGGNDEGGSGLLHSDRDK